MIKNYLRLKNLVPLFFFLFSVATFSQTFGDFRSKATGSWTDTSSWETYNGTAWVNASSYPGQNTGTYTVTIQTAHTISIITNLVTASMGSVIVNGTLNLGSNSGPSSTSTKITLSTLFLNISGGALSFNSNKTELYLPANSVLQIDNGGDIIGACSNNPEIYIGGNLIAVCAGGGGNVLIFDDLVDNGGTINAEITLPITNPSNSCKGLQISLQGGYKGAATGVTYTWIITDPDNFQVTVIDDTGSLADKNASTTPTTFTATKAGNYIISLSVTGGGFTNIETKTIKVSPFNTWNGSVSTDWNTPGNWCTGVPTIGIPNTLDVVIPTGLTNYPIIYDGAVSGYVENIVFEPGTTLNVVDNSLRITNNLTLNGKIDLEGESQLLQDQGSTFDPASTGTIEIDQQGTGNSFRYNYWSSPVNSSGATYTIDEVLRDGNGGTLLNKNITFGASHTFADGIATSPIQLSTYWMYVLRNSNKGYAAWYRVGNTGEVSVGEGYTMKGSNTAAPEQNYTFVGKPNNGNINLPVDKGYDYLVGNPYPSALDAEQLLLDNAPPPVSLEWPKGTPGKITGTIYFWEHYGGDTHNLAGYQGGYATRNLLDGTAASSGIPAGVSNLGSSVKGKPGRHIAVGQAFFVVGDSINGQIHFNNGQRVFKRESLSEAVFMKSSNNKAKTDVTDHSDLRPKFRIGYDAPKISHRQLLIGVDERATNGVDWGFDAEIYEVFADDMYWILDEKKYVIQGTNAVGLNSSEFPLGIQLSKTGLVTVKIDVLENVDDDTSIYLKDKVTGESFNMREKPVQLNLVAGKYADRFVLIFKTQKLVAEDVKAEVLIPAPAQSIIEGIHVFMNNAIGELQIKNNSTEEIVSVALINALGQTVKTWNSNFNIRTISLPISTATGIYLVQINTKTGKTVKKISVE